MEENVGCSKIFFSRFKSKIIDFTNLAFVSVTNTRMLREKVFHPIVAGLHALAQMKREPLIQVSLLKLIYFINCVQSPSTLMIFGAVGGASELSDA